VKVSIILPTYNESGNIVPLVTEISRQIPIEWDYEILVVDDNSPDGTYEIVKQSFKDNPAVIPVLRTTDRGFAKSIRAGIERAQGDHVVVMDTDFTHDPAEIPKLLHVGQVYDIVSGSRFSPGGNMQDRPHYIASLVYNWFIRLLLRTQVQDNLGGYFTMPRQKLLELPLDAIFFGYGDYFVRLLFYAQRVGMMIVEIPAVYHIRDKGTSKSNFLKMLLSYTSAVVSLRLSASGRRHRSTPPA
jgi:dolichol-phosphate mannosyltransferase